MTHGVPPRRGPALHHPGRRPVDRRRRRCSPTRTPRSPAGRTRSSAGRWRFWPRPSYRGHHSVGRGSRRPSWSARWPQLLRGAAEVLTDGDVERAMDLLADARTTDELIRELEDASDEGLSVVAAPRSLRHREPLGRMASSSSRSTSPCATPRSWCDAPRWRRTGASPCRRRTPASARRSRRRPTRSPRSWTPTGCRPRRSRPCWRWRRHQPGRAWRGPLRGGRAGPGALRGRRPAPDHGHGRDRVDGRRPATLPLSRAHP